MINLVELQWRTFPLICITDKSNLFWHSLIPCEMVHASTSHLSVSWQNTKAIFHKWSQSIIYCNLIPRWWSFVGQAESVMLSVSTYNHYILFHSFFVANRADEDTSSHHWRNPGIKTKKVSEILSQLWTFSTSLHCSHFPSASDQLWQEPRKPNRPRPAGQKPGPKRQWQLLWPVCQGLPFTGKRVSSDTAQISKNVCSVSPFLLLCPSCFPSPVSFWPCIDCAVWNWLTTWACMWEWERIWWHEAVVSVPFDSISTNLCMGVLNVMQSSEKRFFAFAYTL